MSHPKPVLPHGDAKRVKFAYHSSDQPASRTYYNSQGAPLTTSQYMRRDRQYKVGTIVLVEYGDMDADEESLGFGQIKSVSYVEEDEDGDSTVTIRWLYSRDDLLAEDTIDKQRLEEMNFEDGDYAISDNEETICVYNVCRSENVTPEFFYDGELHRLEDVNLDAGSESDEDDTDEAEAAKDKNEPLPEHLVILKAWLLSLDIWHDTRYGYDWWFMLTLVRSMGREGNAARLRLQEKFFAGKHRDPERVNVTWNALKSHEQNQHCDACGMDRHCSFKWIETGWNVGQHCKQRIDALKHTCDYIRSIREHANNNKDKLTLSWLKKTDEVLRTLRSRAQEALTTSRI